MDAFATVKKIKAIPAVQLRDLAKLRRFPLQNACDKNPSAPIRALAN
jgi:hypothetical protein